MTDEIKDKICNVINSCSGMNIGTGLQEKCEREINALLPNGYIYSLDFNMSGQVFHHIVGNGEEYNF